jgi:pimeloyl-ACP methyl ester carboxylesterase
VVAHEPPLISVVAGDPEAEAQIQAIQMTIQALLGLVERGYARAAARQFVEEVALGPGAWELLPEPLRQTMVDSGPAFAAEQRDPQWADIDEDALASIDSPVLITQGDESPAWFRTIVAALEGAVGHAEVHTYRGAGHAPHLTHPSDYLAKVPRFLSAVAVG